MKSNRSNFKNNHQKKPWENTFDDGKDEQGNLSRTLHRKQSKKNTILTTSLLIIFILIVILIIFVTNKSR